MLEVRNLKKTYKTKGGVQVHALDDVTIKFPETGMVFLLGKSGSGKSTLLNVSGGLDKPDEGEVIVKGKSSKNFSQADFDSYRNTFVGFVFQEYNILSEFNVETNIALALELQGKKNDKKAVAEILKQVDLEGLGKRKPNTLSGGQKQRIAIARALIKEPEIIMADEPTGALDSNTGKQVLDTLKKLSQTKLVIVVSHDREFAEYYGDRIIELMDGKVITDISKQKEQGKILSENLTEISENTYQIKDASKLKKDEFEELYKKIKASKGEVIISGGEEGVKAFKKASRIDEEGRQEVFKDTKDSNIKINEYDGKDTKFIKSRLPMRHALKMGGSNLKIKPFRLIFTIFLSVVAFTMFGIASTLMIYNSAYTYAKALEASDLQTLVMQKQYNYTVQYIKTDSNGNSSLDDSYDTYRQTKISSSDITKLNQNSLGLDFAGVYTCSLSYYQNLKSSSNLPYYRNSSLYGVSDCGEEYLLRQGFSKIVGSYPLEADEIAISEYTYEVFKESGYQTKNSELEMVSKMITKPADLIGETILTTISAPNYYGRSKSAELKITGIYKTDEYALTSKFNILKDEDNSSVSEREYQDIQNSFKNLYSSSYYGLGYVSPKFYEKYSNILSLDYDNEISLFGTDFFSNRFLTTQEYGFYLKEKEYGNDVSYYFPFDEWNSFEAYVSPLSDVEKKYVRFIDLEGNVIDEPSSTIGNEEIYLNINDYNSIMPIIEEMAYQYDVFDHGEHSYHAYYDGKDELINAVTRYLLSINYSYWGGYDFPFDTVDGDFTPDDFKIILSSYKAFINDPVFPNEYLTDFTNAKVCITNFNNVVTPLTVKGYMYYTENVMSNSVGYVNSSLTRLIKIPEDYVYPEYTWTSEEVSNYVVDRNAQYNATITKSNRTTQELDFMLQEYPDDSYYLVVNNVFDLIRFVVNLIEELKLIFLIIGIVTAVFSGLMLLNFISTSIAAKQKEIGILRAVGARGSDVFKIYFSESGIIGGICFLISCVLSAIGCVILNNSLLEGLNIMMFDFGPLNILFILGVSIFVCFAGTIIPVINASRRPPVESIRAL